LKKILGDLEKVAIQKKSIRAGIGKLRGRRYKKNAGLLLVVGNQENKKVRGIDVVKVNELMVSDLASNGARLTVFSEGAVEDLERVLINKKEKRDDKKSKEKKVDKRKIKKEKRKKIRSGRKNLSDSKQEEVSK
jgi:hypothetical protein